MSKKSKPLTINTRAELEGAMNDFAGKDAELRGVKAELDVALANVREQYAARVALAEEAVEPYAEAIEEWARLNPGEFADKKSIELVAGKIGFRNTPPSVKTLRGVREESAVERVLASQWAACWTRSVVELARDVILADVAAGNTTGDDLKGLGLRIHQAENFYIEPAQAKEGE